MIKLNILETRYLYPKDVYNTLKQITINAFYIDFNALLYILEIRTLTFRIKIH